MLYVVLNNNYEKQQTNTLPPQKNPQTTTLVIQMRTLEILVGKTQIDTKFQLIFPAGSGGSGGGWVVRTRTV